MKESKNPRGAKSGLSWREIVGDFKQSGLEADEYCKLHNISKPDLSKAIYSYDPDRRARRNKPAKNFLPNSFVEVSSDHLFEKSLTASVYRVELELGSSIVLRIR